MGEYERGDGGGVKGMTEHGNISYHRQVKQLDLNMQLGYNKKTPRFRMGR